MHSFPGSKGDGPVEFGLKSLFLNKLATRSSITGQFLSMLLLKETKPRVEIHSEGSFFSYNFFHEISLIDNGNVKRNINIV